MINLTYVSLSRIAPDAVTAEIDLILARSSESNARDALTGGLLFTGTRFVQTLEGGAVSVDAALVRIARDPRHAGLTVIDRRAVVVRNFPDWSLSYTGPSLFVARTVARGLAGFDRGAPDDVARLLRMMIEFGASPPPKRT